ncbi:hypothetical protein ES332_D03G184700v1 [Gossypium tomentosum]|uniref:BTB domain-containing protein n=1 Tax=Gossypium tomentosum TaxID=34277 RepID=A0A5D2LPD8_GOSTO|nr:hypothetical protein ES332_D03G184700v1 [Gossypium tomentosum]
MQCLKPGPELTTTNVVTINVGGENFQTTKQTLTQAGPNSLLSQLAETTSDRFVDRDPVYFSLLLSLLRTGALPSKVKDFDLRDLIEESRYYGLESLLTNSLTNPSQLDAFALQKSSILPLNGRDSPSAVATTPFGSLHVSHGSKITSFDWSLTRKSTILTQFPAVDSLLAISPDTAAAGATDFSGLQILDLQNGSVKQTLNWENATRSGSTVQAIGSSGHNEIFGADIDSAIPATKLRWVSRFGLVMASGSHSGLSGVSGDIRFWDIRSGNVVFELKEKIDCFSDICVSDNLNAVFKVGVNSGEVFYTDFRSLSSVNDNSNPWICLGDKRKVINGKKEGFGCKIENHGNQVFCSKGGDIELWSEVVMGSAKTSNGSEDQLTKRDFKKNMMGRVKDMGGSRITNLAFGGNKMFVTRKDQQVIEIWQGSARGI